MSDTPSVSRRTLAKGAAWTVPAISLAAAAPSLAASPGEDTCPAGPGWRDVGSSRPTWTVTRAVGGGSRVRLNIGDLTPSLNAPAGTTGFRWKPDTVTAVDNSGGSHTGQIVTDTDTAYLIGAGGALGAGVIFDSFAYNSPRDRPRLEREPPPRAVHGELPDPVAQGAHDDPRVLLLVDDHGDDLQLGAPRREAERVPLTRRHQVVTSCVKNAFLVHEVTT